MRLRTFTALDMNEAMRLVRETLGDDAVIISTSRDATGKSVQVTAAAEHDDEEELALQESYGHTSYTNGRESAVNSGNGYYATSNRASSGLKNRYLREIDKILHYHSLPAFLIDKILETSQLVEMNHLESFHADGLREILANLLALTFRFEPLPLQDKAFRMMLIGAPGIGKTITIAKMAAHLVTRKKPVAVISTDSKRAGGIEQLSAFTQILGIDLRVATNRAELRAHLRDVPYFSNVLIDTAGANPYEFDDLKEIGEFAGISEIETVLTCPAGMDCGEAEETARAFSFLGARKLLVTRIDAARRYGAILAAATAADLAFCNISFSPAITEGFTPLDPTLLAELLLRYRTGYVYEE
jgi:flagellar biosynthesis protein FlhF